MKKLTIFLCGLLIVVVGTMFICRQTGILQPTLYYLQIERRDRAANIPVVEAENFDSLKLPDYYNCMDTGKLSKTRDQGDLGGCWAFAANAALESRLLPKEQWDFSEDHMIHNNGFYDDGTQGGDFYMAVAYLAGWKGPVTERQDPYNDGKTNPDAKAVKHLQEALFLDNGDFEMIKKMIYIYGAVESSIYIAIDDEQYIDETYYNKYEHSYCYDGEENANHEIVIIGWDDTYPASNFNTGAYKDGAFICLNSWGSEFGENGVFYISYDDVCIGKAVEVYTEIEDANNYDHNYQYDDHGWVGRMGFEQSEAYFTNVFTAEGTESLEAAAFYATGVDTSYSIYVCKDFQTTEDLLTKRQLKAQGQLHYAGYYTIALDSPVELEAGERYAVIVEINTPGSLHPVAVEMDSGEGRTGAIELAGKESYISADGRYWENAQNDSGCNICLKAFTKDRK